MSFCIDYDELQSVRMLFRAFKIFPQEVADSLRFKFPQLSVWRPLTPADFLASAYFGINILPGSYDGFKRIVDKAYKNAIASGEAAKASQSEIYRIAAEEYGFTSLNDFKAIYSELDRTAATMGVPAYKKLSETAAYIDLLIRTEPGHGSSLKGARQAYVSTFSRYAPYLWDIFVSVRGGAFPSIWLDHLKGEVVYLQRISDCVEAYIIGCPGYQRGIENVLSPRRGLSTTDDLEVVRQMSLDRFGPLPVKFRDMVMVGGAV
ncbi:MULTISPECIES: hypothetical protein [Pseudomonas syringae group]|uniref:Uncharacterized protein n=1 Tax=Pseudomonas serbiensis TaxID=3064350 RepID=A0ABT9CUM8_9PSED|nr:MULTISPECIES: hypothetical protein [Pseudomonas]MBX8548836.1 hypothetical protein [Pseudomonas cichorii]MBX8587460.1 hypothetical protein [Pseudomonas cichorii]MDO7929189.1 hypothetical protein [Pseudomonas sp. KFB-138]